MWFFFVIVLSVSVFLFFFFNDTATTEIYTLSLHDALPICRSRRTDWARNDRRNRTGAGGDRKSTRLNSSHLGISYAVFCLKKKKNPMQQHSRKAKLTIVAEKHTSHCDN